MGIVPEKHGSTCEKSPQRVEGSCPLGGALPALKPAPDLKRNLLRAAFHSETLPYVIEI